MQVSCALSEAKVVFCLAEDIWGLCARCIGLEMTDLRKISQVKLMKIRVEIIKRNSKVKQ